RFLESRFDFLLVVREDEGIIHASRLLMRACVPGELEIEGRTLSELLSPSSLDSHRNGMAHAREGSRAVVEFTPASESAGTVLLETSLLETEQGPVFLFFGVQVDGLSRLSDREKDERIKELSCLYSVAEWIEVSGSIREFFTKLPDFLSRGMQYPERTAVYSYYQGVEYGQKPMGKYISAKLIVNRQVAGEIRVGFLGEGLEPLPEEQRMLSEIARMLSLALERKELSERLALKQEEEAGYRSRLEELQHEIEARTTDLEEQQQKLRTIDSYIDRVNRNWEDSKKRLETVFRAIPDDVALIDCNRDVVMTNRDHVEPGRKCYATFFDRDKPCRNCRLSRIVHEKTPITMTIRNGDTFLEVHALPVFDKNHEVDGIIEFYRDITLEKTYEQQLQQADKLASLGQLVSGIGHEINNPNQFIRGNIKILRQALDDILPIVDEYYTSHPDLKVARLKYDFFRKHVMTLVDDMAHGSERIKGIVEGLKGFARRDEGLLIDRVDLNTIVEAGTRLVHNEVHKHADISLELQPDLPVFTGNSQKIEQVLVNLLVNAGQAMSDDRRGSIAVRTYSADKDVVMEVEDDGKGMNEKTMKQIFDPFFTTKRARGGTGLGLPIAYRIVEEHGGTISVSSSPGEGTRFVIRIPHKGGERLPDQDEAGPGPEDGGEE
ncbi:hypothetical protein JW921_11330, partial [Candidatus Fermentibacterales bacterium]|nr:hypothetical protein [Candidatus Fermentibacterales bacterium]